MTTDVSNPSLPPLDLDPATTALVLVDLQNFAARHPVEPFSGEVVVANAAKLANACRAVGSSVILIQAAARRTEAVPFDQGFPTMQFPADGKEFPDALKPRDGDQVVTKHTWGAFHGTDLNLRLRTRGIRTLILGGITTNYGVESTARAASERGYRLVLAADAMSAFSAREHANAMEFTFPRIGQVRDTATIVAALSSK
jgi:nicotinamidase-related amidase